MNNPHAHYFRVDVREPYMGNTVPLQIILLLDGEKIVRLRVINPEGIITDVHPIPIEEFNG